MALSHFSNHEVEHCSLLFPDVLSQEHFKFIPKLRFLETVERRHFLLSLKLIRFGSITKVAFFFHDTCFTVNLTAPFKLKRLAHSSTDLLCIISFYLAIAILFHSGKMASISSTTAEAFATVLSCSKFTMCLM